MAISRREFMLAGLGLVAAGCTQGVQSSVQRPSPLWPTIPQRPQAHGYAVAIAPPAASSYAPAAAGSGSASAKVGNLPVLSRSQWASTGPIMRRVNPMNGINRITVHHEGWTAVWFTDSSSTVERLDSIRRNHVDRGWADIGYHFVIDRGGRIWEGRSTNYQGAHVSENNEHNLGVMMLGNFELQQPSAQQMATLRQVLRTMMARYNVPVSRVYTHRELKPTTCPGRSLQPQMVTLRRNGSLA
ncbi:MAG: N-acetylmuramoyl-L-alanine amidase [Phycisphaeraceae bacterium]|nr:N-acetylmuramoyl-L-alanine amidase [Phycisphaeraceae bacterium]